MPPPPKSGNGALIAILLGGGLVLVVLIAVVVVVVVAAGGKSPEERLTAAANSLSSARAVKYKGSFSYAADNLQGELTVTRGGRTYGPVTWDGSNVTLLSADEKLFVKGPKSYWLSKLTSSSADDVLKEGDQWGALDSTDLGLRFDRELTPSALATEMRQVSRYTIRETETRVGGQTAYRVGSSLTSFYLSEDGDLLRYESNSSPRVSADVTVQSAAASTTTISQMRNQMGELSEAFDTDKSPRIQGTPEFVDCQPFGDPCTVRANVWSTRGGAPSVPVKVNFRLTSQSGGSGKEFGQCEATGTVTGLDDVPVQCTISGGEWARTGKDYKRVWVNALPVAMAVTPSDVATLQRGLDSE